MARKKSIDKKEDKPEIDLEKELNDLPVVKKKSKKKKAPVGIELLDDTQIGIHGWVFFLEANKYYFAKESKKRTWFTYAFWKETLKNKKEGRDYKWL